MLRLGRARSVAWTRLHNGLCYLSRTLADRPAPKLVEGDDIDPELVALKRSKKGVGPVLGLSVIVLAAYLMITMRDDFTYALRGKTPSQLSSLERLPANQYATIYAAPDFTTTMRVRGKQDTGHRLVAARGTAGRVWLQIEGEPANTTASYESSYSGRLRRLGDLPYGKNVRKYLETRLAAQPRYVFPEALKGGLPTHDVTGDPLAVTNDTRVAVEEKVRDVGTVTVVTTDTVKNVDDATRMLVESLLLPEARKPDESSDNAWTWDISITGGAETIRKTLADKGHAARALVVPKTRKHEGTWGTLEVDEAAVRVGGTSIALQDVERIAVHATPVVAEGAMVLVEGETPDRYWWIPWLYGLLALIAVFMVWAIFRGIREQRLTDELRRRNAETPAS